MAFPICCAPVHLEPAQYFSEVWGRWVLVLWCVGETGEEVGVRLLFPWEVRVGEWQWLGELDQEWHLLLPPWVRGEWVSVRSCPMPTKTLCCRSKARLFSNAAMTTLTKGVLLFWAIACSAHSTGWLYLLGFCQDCLLSHSIMYLMLWGFGCHFFFQKLFDAQLQLHYSMCQTFQTCRERLNKEQPHGRNASLNKKPSNNVEPTFPWCQISWSGSSTSDKVALEDASSM